MFLAQAFRMASQALWGHKTRSMLTILGVVIGTGSVLTVVTLGASFEESIISEFDELDSRSVFVVLSQNGTGIGGGPPDAGVFSKAFSSRDVDMLRAMPGVERVVPSTTMAIAGVEYRGQTLLLDTLTATTADSDDLRDPAAYQSGGVFADDRPEIVLGDTIGRIIGRGQAPVAGDNLTIRLLGNQTVEAKVAGVLAPSDSLFGMTNTLAAVPIGYFYNVTVPSPETGQPVFVFSSLTVVASSVQDVERVRDDVRAYVESDASDVARLIPDGVQVQVVTPDDITSAIGQAFDQVTLFIAAIAVISLVVGAIGIANIMLVAVAERTREIGVMKAIGATDRQIRAMFLVEAMLVGLVGALIGIAVGVAGGIALVEGLFGEAGVAATTPVNWIAIAVGVGVGVGLVAGYLPARRATRIQVVQALAYE